MTKRAPTDLTLRRTHRRLLSVLANGAVTTSIAAPIARHGLTLPEIGAMIRAGEVRTARQVGTRTVCTLACTSLDGRDMTLLIEIEADQATVTGIA